MRYRVNKRTGDKVSEIGFGSAYIYESGTKVAVETIKNNEPGTVNFAENMKLVLNR